MSPEWDSVTITGIAAHAYHGVEEFERQDGQAFSVDVRFWLDTRKAGRTDDLHHTVNYATVGQQVYHALTGRPVNLLETLAHQVAVELLRTHPLMETVEVRVHKPQAPLAVPFQDVMVVVRRSRADVE